jgi:Ca2+-binding RTX toxin-like protein
VTADKAFQTEGFSEIDASSTADDAHIDATQYTADLLVHAGMGADTILLGAGNDTVEFDNGTFSTSKLSSAMVVNGGAGTHDSLLFDGSATVTDGDFLHVSNVEEIDLRDGQFNVTLGANSDAAGIVTIDASQAGVSAAIDGVASTHALVIQGSSLSDLLEGGSGADLIIGGGGGDFLVGGAGTNVFQYLSAADSHQGPGNNLSAADVISDFHTGDFIGIDNIVGGIAAVTNVGTVANFPTADTAGFFGGNAVAVEYDGSSTRVFVDANHDGNFNLNQDLVVQVAGNHVADLTNAASYT